MLINKPLLEGEDVGTDAATPAPETPVAEQAAPAAPAEGTVEAVEATTDPVVEQAEKAARRMKLKIDGIESEYSEDEVIAMAQQTRSAQKKFKEAADMRKESAKFIDMLKKDPKAVLSHPDIGVDVKAFAEEYLLAELEKQEMSPEARENYELKQKLAEKDKVDADREEQNKAAESIKLQEHWKGEYEQSIKGALEKTSIPKTAQSVQRMAIYMSAALENGVDLHPEQAAQMVKQDYLGDIMTLLNQSDGESLLSWLGEETATKIRRTDLARLEASLKTPTVPGSAPTTEGESVIESMPKTTAEQAAEKKMNQTEWREYMEKLRNS